MEERKHINFVEGDLNELENKSLYIIREAAAQFKNIGILWSMGKDATVMLWLIRKAFLGKVPFKVVHVDTGHKFPAMYAMRDKYKEEWNLNLDVEKSRFVEDPDEHREQCGEIKATALKKAIQKHNFDAIFVGIRRDEHVLRTKERFFSPRDKEFKWDHTEQPTEMWGLLNNNLEEGEHMRVHPLLDWNELDLWRYIKRENIPINPLYFSKDGYRYRSLGCMPCTKPIPSTANNVDEMIEELKTTEYSERSGRLSNREKTFVMQRLRGLGYF
jgi:sulfate adenylyltransferase subunit 2